MKRKPSFTDAHLKAIHRALCRLPWQENMYYEDRREVVAMLNKYFREDLEHLQEEKRTQPKEKP